MLSFMRLLAEAADMHPRAIPVIPSLPLKAIALLAEAKSYFTGREPYPTRQHVRMSRLHWYVKSHKAETHLGYRSRPLTSTLNDTYRWYLDQQMISLRSINRWWMRPGRAVGKAA
jgi:hypothetical protein